MQISDLYTRAATEMQSRTTQLALPDDGSPVVYSADSNTVHYACKRGHGTTRCGDGEGGASVLKLNNQHNSEIRTRPLTITWALLIGCGSRAVRVFSPLDTLSLYSVVHLAIMRIEMCQYYILCLRRQFCETASSLTLVRARSDRLSHCAAGGLILHS